MRLVEKDDMHGSNRIVNARFLVGFCKLLLKDKLMGDNVERGPHATVTTEVDGVKMIAVAYRGKSNHHNNPRLNVQTFTATSYHLTALLHLREDLQRRRGTI
eukprot:7182725-Ditylum_brightwellii.AAC.1